MSKVTHWKAAAKDGDTIRVRDGAWEVHWPAGQGRLNIATFTGPDAKSTAKRFAEWVQQADSTEDDEMEDWLNS